MARDGLKLDIASAIRSVKTRKITQTHNGLQVKYNGGSITVNISLRPISRPDSERELFLIAFESVEPSPDKAAKKKRAGKKNEYTRINSLEKELLLTKENLNTTIEELETSNEELKSTNEELQSTNEELQSANEELETSKEEQQSLNEELTTVNSELQGKIDELVTSNNDMKNLLNSINIPTIFLDMDLCIKRFSSNATRVINLIQTDIGRPLSDLVVKLKYNTMIDDAREVLRDLIFREREVETVDGEWYAIKLLPYRTVDNVIDGIVITFQDLGERKKIENALIENARQFNEVQKIAHVGSWYWLPDSETVVWSDELYRIAGRDPKQPPFNLIKDFTLYSGKSREQNKNAAEKILLTGEPCELELELLRPDGEARQVLAHYKTLKDGNGRVVRLFGTIQDITDLNQIRQEITRLSSFLDHNPCLILEIDAASGELNYANPAARDVFVRLSGADSLPPVMKTELKAMTDALAAGGKESAVFNITAGGRVFLAMLFHMKESGMARACMIETTGLAVQGEAAPGVNMTPG